MYSIYTRGVNDEPVLRQVRFDGGAEQVAIMH